jgi:hypothetical protein
MTDCHTVPKMHWGHIKWADEAEHHEYIAVPNAFFAINKCVAKEAKLTPTEYIVLLMLIAFDWKVWPDRPPRISTKELALRANVSRRQVFRALNALRKKRWILRIGHGAPWYDATPTKLNVRALHDADELKFG